MSTPKYADLKAMHLLFCELTGVELAWSMSRLYEWECFSLRFTERDLCTVIAWIKKRKRDGKPARELTFRSLISGGKSLDYFEEDLAQAKAEGRAAPHTERQSVLRATGRQELSEKPAMSAATVLEQQKLAEMLRHWREQQV